MRRTTLTATSVTAFIVVTALYWLALPEATDTPVATAPDPVLWPEPRALPEFRLLDQHGAVVTRDDFRDRFSLVFFGYLDCPDVCPTSLTAMQAMAARLRDQPALAGRTRFVLVSVDPERDDPARMKAYLASFDAGFIGLTGAPDMIERLSGAMAAFAVREQGVIRHSSSLMIVGPDARIHGAFQPPLLPGPMSERFVGLFRAGVGNLAGN